MRKTIYVILKSPGIACVLLGALWCSLLNCFRDGFAAETARLERMRDALSSLKA